MLPRTAVRSLTAILITVLTGALLAGCTTPADTGQPPGQSESEEPPPVGTVPNTGTNTAAPQGTPGWRLTHPAKRGAIEGYADRVSVRPGEPVRLYVSTTAPGFTVTAFRFGDYRDSEAVRVWQSAPEHGVRQPPPIVQPPTNTVVAPWRPSLTVDTADWQPGDYLLRLDAADGSQQYVPLTVRTPDNTGRIVVVNAVTTWQAYNRWGDYSLYESRSGKAQDRSRAVSFDRPYQAQSMQGAGDFLYFELPFLLFAERAGVQLGYATDVDLHADPHLLDGAAAVVTLGHDEYWSGAMRNNVVRARDSGTNLAFLGGNEIYRHIRLDPTPNGPDRLETDYKNFAADPASKTNPLDATQEWRLPPDPRPESVLLGNFYQCNPVQGDMVTADAGNWLLSGIVRDGQVLPGLIGNEYEAVDLAVPTPRPIEILFHSPVTCQQRPGFADVSYYTTPSGAAVFSTGTQYWICGLDPGCPNGGRNPVVAQAIGAITGRLLTAFAAGPTGRTHPASDNLAALHVPGATPNPPPTIPPALVPTSGPLPTTVPPTPPTRTTPATTTR